MNYMDQYGTDSKRMECKNLIRKWDGIIENNSHPTKAGVILAGLFGYENYTTLNRLSHDPEYGPEICRKLDMLLGPNGYTVYRAWKVCKNG